MQTRFWATAPFHLPESKWRLGICAWTAARLLILGRCRVLNHATAMMVHLDQKVVTGEGSKFNLKKPALLMLIDDWTGSCSIWQERGGPATPAPSCQCLSCLSKSHGTGQMTLTSPEMSTYFVTPTSNHFCQGTPHQTLSIFRFHQKDTVLERKAFPEVAVWDT